MAKNCSNVRGYSCGQACISRNYACRIEISGQAITIASRLTNTIQKISNGLFPDPDSFPPLPDLPVPRETKPYKPKPAKSFKLPPLDLSKVDSTKLNGLNPADTATEIAKQLRKAGYQGRQIVKGSTIMLPNNGIIEVNDNGSIEVYKIDSRLKPLINKLEVKR